MKTHKLMFTKGDRLTQPGGLILRSDDEETSFVTHRFNRVPHTREPAEFFWGHYFDSKEKAMKDYYERAAELAAFEISEAELIAKGDVDLQPEFD